ncbi:MAG: M1 family metallopeptidase [Bacteroidetes bacterium]|nr:M1 family metallopeptidase [Bacteroidota bacterium]
MKITYRKIIFSLFTVVLGACSLLKNNQNTKAAVTTLDSASMSKIIDAINKNKEQRAESGSDDRPYEASATKFWDLINTNLAVEFDYSKAQLTGMATITLKPHAYAQDSLVLDAKGMDILSVIDGDTRGLTNLIYSYNGKKLTIFMPSKVQVGARKKIVIDYIAKPNEIVVKGSEAITSDKGLYFINNEGIDTLKPRQIWTQGETESNSCWFPTIDKPNQKMTQEIAITIQDSGDITLSNGLFLGRVKNRNGSYTDTWRQAIPAAPYLTMMAIGNFYIERDSWRGLEVNYYVEPKYQPFAKLIFGKTPDMLEFFSTRLGVDFPWEKYSQIVVRDYVSGSMENASATLHGEFLQYDSRDYLDNNKEDYLSHELFHQWFGDLVTCESWSNLALNESFGTYGEYLWIEHTRGKMEADKHLEAKRDAYIDESKFKQEPIIRFHYEDKEDMFDRHSYQKGGCILHLLRTQLGDEVFFKGLQLYLTKNRFKSVEVHDFRLAMEEASGEDLNWFFNQWFLSAGHPKVIISNAFSAIEKSQTLKIDFVKEDETTPRKFILPLKVDFYFKDSIHRENITIHDWTNQWVYHFNDSILLINVDADRSMLWEMTYEKPKSVLMYQVLNAPLYQDKREAMISLLNKDELTINDKNTLLDYCLNHPSWIVEEMALEILEFMKAKDLDPYFNKLAELVIHQRNSSLRVSLLQVLDKMQESQDVLPILRACTNDSSYWVMATALELLHEHDLGSTLKICNANEHIENSQVMSVVHSIYCKDTTGNHSGYFLRSIKKAEGIEKTFRLNELESYLRETTPEYAYQTILMLTTIRDQITNDHTRGFFPDAKNFFETKRFILADEMSRTRYTEEAYKEVSLRLEMYDKIIALLQ